jgi:hypothetical protein
MRLARPSDKTVVARVVDARCGWMETKGLPSWRGGRAGVAAWLEASRPRPAVWMTRALAHQALAAGHRRQARDLAIAALARAAGQSDGATEALLHITHARAWRR